MRKKCDLCGLICFDSEETCRRCGSDRLSVADFPGDTPARRATTPARKSKKLKFVKYFIFMIFAQIGLLFVSAISGVPIIFQVFYEPVFVVVARLMGMGHADVIVPLLLIVLTFFAYAGFLSYLLVYSRFRDSVLMPASSGVQSAFTNLRAKVNGRR